ncbi:winged helix-turn-helix transcriptional regulator [Nanoarchaeota archaeon NZ13-N]|nr:MAG: winged helix-turn-helix transcriptional regulator [Nanoarchaeota archaeon NZ13-N]
MVRKSEIDINNEILEILKNNSRSSYTEIGKMLNLSEGAIRKRVRKMIEEGVIKKFTVIIDYKKVGKVESLTGINVSPESLLKVIEEIKKIDKIDKIYITSGDHTLIVDIVANSFEELDEIHKKIESIDGVINVYPAPILEIIR